MNLNFVICNCLRSGDAVYVAEIGPNRLRKFEVIIHNMQNIKCKKIAQKESKYQQKMYEYHWKLMFIVNFKLKCLT